MKKLYPILIVLLLLVSCSLNKNSDENTAQVKGVLPDLITINTSSKIGQDDGSVIELEAERMALYSTDNYALLENFSFIVEKDGNTEASGNAEKGRIELDGSLIELEGAVTFMRDEDNMLIKAEHLIYNKESDEITTTGTVVVNSEEGKIEGENFKGDLKRGLYSFSAIHKGEFNLE